jgi:uncharacterized DUF497 family protein
MSQGICSECNKPYKYIANSVVIMIIDNYPDVLFDWDVVKDAENQQKHGVQFELAQQAFLDPNRIILNDVDHSRDEARYYCLGRVLEGILTVRFTDRENVIRIIGAGFWRKGRRIYEKKNKVYR